MDIKSQRLSELTLLFVLLPIMLLAPLPIWFLVLLALSAVGYCLLKMRHEGLLSRSHLLSLPEEFNYRPMVLRFIVFAILSTALVAWLLPDKLFFVITGNPLLWLSICIFYTVMSVYPQEIIYRQFFQWRYAQWIKPSYFITINAVLFSLAHLIFMNLLVMVLTLLGGFLFARTYQKSGSVLLTSIEHAAYGLWLFSVGLGEMLAFPAPNMN